MKARCRLRKLIYTGGGRKGEKKVATENQLLINIREHREVTR